MNKNTIKQHLPTYIHKFKKYPNWITKETPHYIFFYTLNSLAEKEINYISSRQEKAYSKIVSFLKTKGIKRKISYYLYPNHILKKNLMGDDWFAQSIVKDFCIHCLYTKNIKPIGEHEDTHLLSLLWGYPIGFLREGLAEYLVGNDWHGKNHDTQTKIGFKKKIFPNLKTMMNHKGWLDTDDSKAIYFYCLAGSFVKFLINKFGKNKFKMFYQNAYYKNSASKNIKIFEDIYKISFNDAEKMWRDKVYKTHKTSRKSKLQKIERGNTS